MSEPERQHYEKYEKEEEKHEKEHEKSWDEKWRRDPLSAAVWAFVLIWAGLVLLASNLGLVAGLDWFKAWGAVMTGAGAIVFLEVVIRLLVPAYRRPVGGTLILAAVFLGIGLGDLFGYEIFLPLVVIAIGAGMLLRSAFKRR